MLDSWISKMFVALYVAVPLFLVTWVFVKAGWKPALVQAMPMYCCYSLGQLFAHDKWFKDRDRDWAKLKAREDAREKVSPDARKPTA